MIRDAQMQKTWQFLEKTLQKTFDNILASSFGLFSSYINAYMDVLSKWPYL